MALLRIEELDYADLSTSKWVASAGDGRPAQAYHRMGVLVSANQLSVDVYGSDSRLLTGEEAAASGAPLLQQQQYRQVRLIECIKYE